MKPLLPSLLSTIIFPSLTHHMKLSTIIQHVENQKTTGCDQVGPHLWDPELLQPLVEYGRMVERG